MAVLQLLPIYRILLFVAPCHKQKYTRYLPGKPIRDENTIVLSNVVCSGYWYIGVFENLHIKSTQTIGRFAPSPTGPLHLGSLVAAVGSYCQTKSKNGQWWVRIEYLDPPCEKPGASGRILQSLEAHGLYWEGDVIYQSQRHEAYRAALETLLRTGLAYPCRCSRKSLRETAKQGQYGLIYPGSCRNGLLKTGQPYVIRVLTDNNLISFNDGRTGYHAQRLESEIGDYIIRRADGLFAYQLAVVIDDAWQGMTEIVRGEDLLD